MTQRIAVIDYGMGNLHSAAKALEHVAPDAQIFISSEPEKILQADKVVFPGVGAIRDCMGEICRLGLDEVVREACKTKPLLAICVGMQCLMDFSEENNGVDCLGIFKGQVRYFGDDLKESVNGESVRLKVPHMGWNQLKQTRAHPLWAGIPDESRFYFVHSYFVSLDDARQQVGKTHYGQDFTASIAQDNVFAVQFHPEKSQHNGLQLLSNFTKWDGGF